MMGLRSNEPVIKGRLMTIAQMPRPFLPETKIPVSRFIFGTSSLFAVGGTSARIALLEAAADAGFTHFDTAPYYGFGWAERDLGEVLRRRPDLTVTTKVGIYSPGGENVSRAMVFLRKAAGRVIPAISKPTIDFSLARARTMLEASLIRLGRSHIELYMLHEPELKIVQTEEWQRWLEDELGRGRIGAFGLALTRERLIPFLEKAPGLAPVVQVLDSLERREADCLTAVGRPLQITYGYVSAARAAGSERSVEDILAEALARNSSGAIIVSTTKKARVGQYARLLEALA